MSKRIIVFVRTNSLLRQTIVKVDVQCKVVTLKLNFRNLEAIGLVKCWQTNSIYPFPEIDCLVCLCTLCMDIKCRARNLVENTFVTMRDGRDVMVSYYYHSYYYHSMFFNELYNQRLVERIKSCLNIKQPEKVIKIVPRFVEFSHQNRMFPRFTWSEFARSWLSCEAHVIKYEELLVNAPDASSRAIKEVDGRRDTGR